MQSTSFTCDCCKKRIEDEDCPVVVYVVAGLVPMHPKTQKGAQAVDVTDYPMSQYVRDLLAKPIAREEFCAACFAEKMGHPLVTPEPAPAAPPPAPAPAA